MSIFIPSICTFQMIHDLTQASSDIFRFLIWVEQFALDEKAAGPNWYDIAKDWQTLIAGLVAFVPAALAAVFVWKQLNEQRHQFFKSQQTASFKARLRLSRNISHISQHLDMCYDKLLLGRFSFTDHTLPDSLLDDILDAGVNSSADNLPFFQNYIQKLQSFSSICAIHADVGGESNLAKCFELLGEVDVLTDQLYPFSRFESDKIKKVTVSQGDIRARLEHNLRRGKDINNTNLSELLSLGYFQG